MLQKTQSLQTWKGFHWSFFIMTQALIICLQRFQQAIQTKDMDLAQTELSAAANLMLASGAAMELAGSFQPSDYADEVRNTMIPPSVKSDNFSGLMAWDHAFLIKIWQRLKPIFANLPPELQSSHEQFVLAYKTLAYSHKAVCSKFGGSQSPSLVGQKAVKPKTAVENLEQFEHNREQLLDPNHLVTGCPFHHKSA